MNIARHSWAPPLRSLHKSERECLNGCGLVKVTRHEGERHWIEFWRDGVRLNVSGTPPCTAASIAEEPSAAKEAA